MFMANFGKDSCNFSNRSPPEKWNLNYFCLHQCSFKFKLGCVICGKACDSVTNYVCSNDGETAIPKWLILK